MSDSTFTAFTAKNLKPKKIPYKVSTGRGFYMYISPQGNKSWRYDYTAPNGTRKTLTLGTYPKMTLAEAGIEHAKAKDLLQHDIDPSTAKKDSNAGKYIFANLAEKWLVSVKKNIALHTYQNYSRYNARYLLPYIGTYPLNKLTRQVLLVPVNKLLDEDKQTTAVHVARLIQMIMRYAITQGFIHEEKYYLFHDLSRAIPARKRQNIRNFPALTNKQEVGDLLRNIELCTNTQESSLPVSMACRLLPYVFLRIGTLTSLEWHDIDLENALLTVPPQRMKMRVPFTIPLARQAVEILKTVYQYRQSDRYVFSVYGLHPITRDAVRNLHVKAGAEKGKMTLHGWRSTWATLAREEGLPDKLVEYALAHQSGGVTVMAYNRASYKEPMRQAVQWWADYLDALKDGTTPPKIPVELATHYA